MIRIFGLAVWTARDVENLYAALDRTADVAAEAKGNAVHYMRYSEMMFKFIMRNLPLKRKRRALRAMLARMKEGGRR